MPKPKDTESISQEEHEPADTVYIVGAIPIDVMDITIGDGTRVTTQFLITHPDLRKDIVGATELAFGAPVQVTTWGEYRSTLEDWNRTNPESQFTIY
jgi:hypothetical protein